LVILFKVDYYNLLEENIKLLVKLRIPGIIHELWENRRSYIAIPMANGEFIAVLNVKVRNAAADTELYDNLIEIRGRLKNIFGITLSIGISDCIEHIADIKKTYEQVRELLKFRLVNGPESLFRVEVEGSNPRNGFEYPGEIEKSIIAAINMNRREDYISEVEKLLNLADSLNYKQFYNVLIQMAVLCIKTFNVVSHENRVQTVTDYSHMDECFGGMENIEDVRKWFMELYEQHESLVEGINESKGTRQMELIMQVIEYIKQNFSNPNISVDMLAEKAGLSTSYFSKIFKTLCNVNVSDFITELRLEHAKSLLKETEMNIDEIAVKSGFLNTNYFYRVFKKGIGLTPSKYRILYQNNYSG